MTVRLRNNVQIHGPAGGTGGLTAPTVGENGYVAIAGSGDLTYLPGTNNGDVLTWVSATTEWVAAAGGGDVIGPASSLDNQIARFHSTTGKIIQAGTDAPTYDDSGNLSINAGTSLRLWNAAGTFYVGLVAPTVTASHTLVLPLEDGTAGQALVTDGDGNLSFASVGAGSGVTDHGALTGLSDTNDHTWAFLIDGTRTAAYIKFGTYPATAGYVRLPNEGAIYARNAADSANLHALRVDASNQLYLGEYGTYGTYVMAGSYAGLYVSGGAADLSSTRFYLSINASTAALAATGAQSFFRYHDTLCVATETGRSTVAPMDVT